MKLIFATGNAGKLREAREILGPGYEVLSPAEAGLGPEALDVEENGSTFAENAYIKAAHIHCGLPVFADDSGLEVDALNGEPGIFTARYAGAAHDIAGNIAKLLRKLSEAGAATPEERKARFRCAVSLILDGKAHSFDGSCEGHIADAPAGDGGFGYDPVFVADAFPGRTLAQVPEDDKNGISHRGEALRKMAEWLRQQAS